MNKRTEAHTLGPWKIDEDNDLPLAIIEDTDDGLGICEVGYLREQKSGATPKQLAIARLIAAAPDLLAACNALFDVQSRRRHPLGAPNEGIAYAAAAATNKARAAIAKAGES